MQNAMAFMQRDGIASMQVHGARVAKAVPRDRWSGCGIPRMKLKTAARSCDH